MKDEYYSQTAAGDRSIELLINAGDLREIIFEIVDEAFRRKEEEIKKREEEIKRELENELNLLTQEEAALIIGKSKRTLQRYASEGILIPMTSGQTPKYTKFQLLEYLRSLKDRSNTPVI